MCGAALRFQRTPKQQTETRHGLGLESRAARQNMGYWATITDCLMVAERASLFILFFGRLFSAMWP